MKILSFVLAFFLISLNLYLASAKEITMTILYDNYVYEQNTRADWGFSCLIEGTEKTILFDTGYDGTILLENVDSLNIDLSRIEQIVISHDHLDHTGGLNAVLNINSDVSVYFGATFPPSFSQSIDAAGATPIQVTEPFEICKNVFTTGELSGPVYEQSLIIDSDDGLIVITGCSHPGIVNIVRRAKEIMNKDVYLVFGGFHLVNSTTMEVKSIIEELKALGVKKIGPSHCTGDNAIAQFRIAFGDDFVQMGVGRIINTTITSVPIKNKSSQPSEIEMNQNFPNPFNAFTEIRYKLHQPNMVRCDVYNLLGQKVITINHEYQNAGLQRVIWDGKDKFGQHALSGTYLCKLSIANYTEVKKMTLLK